MDGDRAGEGPGGDAADRCAAERTLSETNDSNRDRRGPRRALNPSLDMIFEETQGRVYVIAPWLDEPLSGSNFEEAYWAAREALFRHRGGRG